MVISTGSMFTRERVRREKGTASFFSCFLVKKKGGDFSPPRFQQVGPVSRPTSMPYCIVRSHSSSALKNSLARASRYSHSSISWVGVRSARVKVSLLGRIAVRFIGGENGPRAAEHKLFFDYFRDISRANRAGKRVNA